MFSPEERQTLELLAIGQLPSRGLLRRLLADYDAMREALRPLAALAPYYKDTSDSGPVFVPVVLTGADCHRAARLLE